MAERRATAVQAEEVTTPTRKTMAEEPRTESKDEYDGQGDRALAVRRGEVEGELVANGLTTVQAPAKPEKATGRFVAETNLDPAPEEEQKPPRQGTRAGEVVEGYSEDQMQKFLASGAVRYETEDDVRKD